MEIALFIVKAMAGAALGEVAKDTYEALKARLSEAFGLQAGTAVLESKPEGQAEQEFLSAKLIESGAVDDPMVLDAAEIIAAELEKLPEDTPLGANFTVKDLKAEHATFKKIRVGRAAEMKMEGLDIHGKLTVEDVKVGDDDT